MNAIPETEKFDIARELAFAQDSPIELNGTLPGERCAIGDSISERIIAVDTENAGEVMLLKKLAEGGEGSIFLTNLPHYVAKIYRRDKLTLNRKNKIKLMISKRIRCDGICFPESLALNEEGEFVGFMMKAANGYELGKSVFQPKLLQKKFPGWTRRDTVELSITILERIQFLNERNVIVGDINPANILVVSPSLVFFVDCDSYQVEGYPCPVGTVNFTPPEAQGRDYKSFLRTQPMENFAIATLLFMIMLPGKPPYSAVGGESPELNIRNGEFPYAMTGTTDKTPPGMWGQIWENTPTFVQRAFYETFRQGQAHFSPHRRYNAREWLEVFRMYRMNLGAHADGSSEALAIFPGRGAAYTQSAKGGSFATRNSSAGPIGGASSRPSQTSHPQSKRMQYGAPVSANQAEETGAENEEGLSKEQGSPNNGDGLIGLAFILLLICLFLPFGGVFTGWFIGW